MADDLVVAVVGLGQSWMQGGSKAPSDQVSTPEAEHPGFALELDTRPRPTPGYKPRLVDLRERAIVRRERPLSGCADAIERGLLGKTGARRALVMITSARGGSTLKGGMLPDDGLLPGSFVYQWMLTQVSYVQDLVRALGKRLVVTSIIAAHGETDAQLGQPGRPFAEDWSQVRRQAENDIRRTTGQAEPVLLHIYQTTGLNRRFRPATPPEGAHWMADVAWWQLRIGEIDPLCRCVGPVYWIERGEGDPVHASNRSLRRIGLQFGRYVYEDIFENGREPLRIERLSWAGPLRLRVAYGREIEVEADDAIINTTALGAAKGYALVDAEGEAGSAILRLERAPDQKRGFDLILERAAASPGGRLLAAWRPTGMGIGRDTSARTAVRSSQPFDHDPQDGFALHDWACVESVALPHPVECYRTRSR
jgi:hypothetical protein